MRSRAVSLPLSCCRSIRLSPPPRSDSARFACSCCSMLPSYDSYTFHLQPRRDKMPRKYWWLKDYIQDSLPHCISGCSGAVLIVSDSASFQPHTPIFLKGEQRALLYYDILIGLYLVSLVNRYIVAAWYNWANDEGCSSSLTTTTRGSSGLEMNSPTAGTPTLHGILCVVICTRNFVLYAPLITF